MASMPHGGLEPGLRDRTTARVQAEGIFVSAQILRGTTLDIRLVISRAQPGTVLAETARSALAPYGAPLT